MICGTERKKNEISLVGAVIPVGAPELLFYKTDTSLLRDHVFSSTNQPVNCAEGVKAACREGL